MLFDKDGFLNLDEAVLNNASFLKIMEDGVVTNGELAAQTQKVSDLLHETEKRFFRDDVAFIEQLLVETNVLYAVFRKYELQNMQ